MLACVGVSMCGCSVAWYGGVECGVAEWSRVERRVVKCSNILILVTLLATALVVVK